LKKTRNLGRRIPGGIASDLGTRKAQAFKAEDEDGEVILSGNGSGTLESCMTSAFCLTWAHTHTSPVLPIRPHTPTLPSPRLPSALSGAPEAMAHR
jgi:hypothetical protein